MRADNSELTRKDKLKSVWERGQESRGRKKKHKGKPRKELPEPELLLEKLKTGKSTKDLAKEYDVNPGTIRNRLIEYNRKAYNEIARDRTSPKSNGQRIDLPVQDYQLYEQWKKGMPIRALAKKYKVSRQTITRRLREYNEQEQRELAKKKIADSIARRKKHIPVTPTKVSERYANGESATKLADEFNVSRPTITRLLEKFGGEDYEKTALHRILTGRTKKLLVPTSEAFDKWENGETPENLEKLCGISYRQLLEKLKAYDPARYKEVAQRRGLGSIRAKQHGARSLFELNVRRILEKHGILTKETTLKLGRHHYRPDCLIPDQKTIIEAMGLNIDSYWKHQHVKTEDYLSHEHKVVAVVPTEQLYRKAKKYLSKKVEIVRLSELDNFVATSLEKVPHKTLFQ